MEVVVRLKIEQNDLMDDLQQTGEIPIIEDCTSRPYGSGLFWGAKRTESGWIGDNHLGKIWMKIRDEHKNTLTKSKENLS